MNSQTSDTATGEAVKTESQDEVKEQTATTQPNSFADALAAIAKQQGHEIGDVAETQQPGDEPAEQVGDIPAQPDEQEAEDETKEDEQPQEVESAEGHKSIDEQIAEAQAKGEKPKWYLKRIVEEREKRGREKDARTEAEGELARIRQENQNLLAQVNQASRPQPTPDQPLIDVYDEPTLQKLEGQYEEVLKFAIKNPDGGELVIGKNPDGTPKTQEFAPDEIAEMRYKADRAIRKDLPQRRALLAERQKMEAVAVEVYPEYKDPSSAFTQTALAIVRQNPMLLEVLGPEAPIWIGHALYGRSQKEADLKGKNGSNGSTTDKIVKAAKNQIAPTPTRTRSIPERRSSSVSLEKAEKKFEARGDTDSAEEVVSARLQAALRGNQVVEPIRE